MTVTPKIGMSSQNKQFSGAKPTAAIMPQRAQATIPLKSQPSMSAFNCSASMGSQSVSAQSFKSTMATGAGSLNSGSGF